jgi:hypothetical protein
VSVKIAGGAKIESWPMIILELCEETKVLFI